MSDLVASETLQPVLDLINDDLDNAINRLQEFLQIPSISTDSEYTSEVRRCAEHITSDLTTIGLDVTLHDTIGHPMVVATDDSAGPDAPRVLYYGHYDVQPPDPMDEWISEPFEPTVRDGNVFARGATDDKGQMLTHIKSAQAWMETAGSLPVQIKYLIEGEEEVCHQPTSLEYPLLTGAILEPRGFQNFENCSRLGGPSSDGQ